MKWPPWGKSLQQAKAETADAERKLEEVRSQRDEVDELAQWARAARERNHLTDLFFSNRRPQHRGGHA